MNVKHRPIIVMPLLHVTTPLDLLAVHANQATLAMVSLVLVSFKHNSVHFNLFIYRPSHYNTFYSDIDECETETDNCDAAATCTNTVGSFSCTCSVGYNGDGVTCTGKFMRIFRLISFYLSF